MATTEQLRGEVRERLQLRHLDTIDLHREFRDAVERGLSATPKAIPPKFFYDARGSELFEEITRTPEYYLTRTEAYILEQHGHEMLQAAGREPTLVEFGSGSSRKTRLLLDRLAAAQERMTYVPVDISPSIVAEHARRLLADYPGLTILGLIGDYHHAIQELHRTAAGPRLFLFLGSTLGNLEPAEAAAFLKSVRQALGPRDHLLLGTDLVKEPGVLEGAYNDAAGVTAAFNRNLLQRINAELGGRFDPGTFRHVAFFNQPASRIEMHLESLRQQAVRVEELGRDFPFAAGETIHTENSHKYNYLALERLVREAGLRLKTVWHDPEQWFAVSLLGPA